MVTKLKGWKEFFDPEEFQFGIELMQKPEKKKVLTELSEEDGGSDSEPSVDNFDN